MKNVSRRETLVLVATATCVTAFATAVAPAQEVPAPVRAAVVQLEERDVFVDVGAPHARQGLELDVYRGIEVRHPLTKRVLRDRYVIGRLVIVQPGATISIARVRATPHRPIAVGDVVETDAPAPAPAPLPPAPATPAPPAPPDGAPALPAPPPATCPPCDAAADAETADILATWRATLGRSPAERVAIFSDWARRHPGSRWHAYVVAETRVLASLGERMQPRAATPEEIRRDRLESLASALEMDVPLQAREGDPVELALRVGSGSAVRAVVAHLTRRGSEAALLGDADSGARYRTLPMRLDEHGHARVRVPAEYVRPPGFAFFVQAVGEDGVAIDAVASADRPAPVDVRPRRVDVWEPAGRSRVRFSSEWVSFDATSQRDWYLDVEGDFLYRLLWSAFYGLRVGYGHYRGEGGTVAALDVRGEEPVPVGFTYGFVETEFRAGEIFAAIVRATTGLGREDVDRLGANRIRTGIQLRARIGRERGTSLVLAAETIPEIGQRAFLGLSWESIPRVPMAAEVHVTDQPVNSGELGVRGVFEIGWRPWDPFALSARLSYQGRTIDHAGPGAGVAATFDW